MEIKRISDDRVTFRIKVSDLKDETVNNINKELKRIHHKPINKDDIFAIYSFESGDTWWDWDWDKE